MILSHVNEIEFIDLSSLVNPVGVTGGTSGSVVTQIGADQADSSVLVIAHTSNSYSMPGKSDAIVVYISVRTISSSHPPSPVR